MSTGYDMETMANLYTNGLPYSSVPVKDDPMVSTLSIPIGRVRLCYVLYMYSWLAFLFSVFCFLTRILMVLK